MKKILPFWVALVLCATTAQAQHFSAYDLECEALADPLAINTPNPRFTWKVAADGRGFTQQGYELIVSDNERDAAAGRGNLWRKKETNSSQSLFISYQGKALQSGAKYYWAVRLFGPKGEASPWSAPRSFSVGLLDRADWSGAEWIAMEIMPAKERLVPGLEYNKLEPLGDRKPGLNKLPQFRKEFEARKPIRRAMAYVSGLGQFELFLNGEKVGDHFLDPAWTDFDKQIAYVPFDVTDQLRDGLNAVGVMLGNGFVSTPRERYYKALISYCYPMMILKLQVEYADGSVDTLVSDTSWKTTESAVTYSSIFGGEDFDASRELAGWKQARFDDSAWQHSLIAPQTGQLTAQMADPIRLQQQFPFVTVRRTKYGKWLYDLGQNIAGTVKFTVRGRKGDSYYANTCEQFDPAVDSITKHGGYRGEYRIGYTFGEEGAKSWQPQFTYHGFRYILVSGAVPAGVENPEGLPVIEDIRGLHMRNSAAISGVFDCSNELLNKTHELIEWGVKGNMASSFTDCPHREKLPWIEQLHLMFGSLQYNFDIYKLVEKMAVDMELAQHPNGLIPDIAPMYVQFFDGFVDSPEWGSAFVIAPWKVYEYYGDRSLVERHYEAMARYLDYLTSKSDDYILSHGLGDWYDLGPNYPGVAQLTSKAATATPIYYMDAEVMRKAAELLGRTEDAARFAALSAKIKASYNAKFYNPEGGYYDRNSQTANAIAICAGLVAPENHRAVLDNLIQDIRARGNALTAGDVGFNYVLRALEENNASQVIFDMNSRYDVYGYGYMLAKDATALAESWRMEFNRSYNHLMLGHLQEWFYSSVAGIRKGNDAIGFRSIVIRPDLVGDLNSASAAFESPYGTVSNRWKKQSDRFEMTTQIPANTTALIYIPAAKGDVVTESGVAIGQAAGVELLPQVDGRCVCRVGSGTYRFEVRAAAR